MGGRVNTRADRCFYTKRRRAERDPSRGQRLACPSTCTPVFNPPLFDCLALCTDGQVMTRCDDVWKRTVARATNCLLPLFAPLSVWSSTLLLDSSTPPELSVGSIADNSTCYVTLVVLQLLIASAFAFFRFVGVVGTSPTSPRGIHDHGILKADTKKMVVKWNSESTIHQYLSQDSQVARRRRGR